MPDRLSCLLFHFVFKPQCFSCSRQLPRGQLAFCLPCARFLLGSPSPSGALLEYLGPGRSLLSALREGAPQRAADWALELLERRGKLREWRAAGVEVVTHAPQSAKKQPSGLAILAEAVAGRLEAQFLHQAFSKRAGVRQHGRSLQRRMDVSCFVELARPASWVRGKQVLVLDDVATTGTTLDLCAYVLRKAGASKVRQFSLAKQVMHGLEGKGDDADKKG